MEHFIAPSEAYELLCEHLPQKGKISKSIHESIGRVLAQPIWADRDFPPYNRSMMDGFAVFKDSDDSRATVELAISDMAAAGAQQTTLNKPSLECIEIATGAMLPMGANAVVPYEESEQSAETTVQFPNWSTVNKGDCIHDRGADLVEGAVILAKGRKIGSREIAILATCGKTIVQVAERPTISILTTGDECIDIHQQPEAYQLRRSNDRMIKSILAEEAEGSIATDHLDDDREAIRRALKAKLATNDILVMSGGISKGRYDFIPEVLNELGFVRRFHGVAQKPGRPFGFWTHDEAVVIALPGNPLSCLCCLHALVIPAMRQIYGRTLDVAVTARLQTSVPCRDDLELYLPVKLAADGLATPAPFANSGDLVKILDSDGYICLPPNADRSYKANELFEVHFWK